MKVDLFEWIGYNLGNVKPIEQRNFLIIGELMNKSELINYVKRAVEHDHKAIEALYQYTYSNMYSMVSHLCANQNDVEDILQDGYIKAFEKLDTLKEKVAFVSWLKKIMVNEWRAYAKDKSVIYETTIFEGVENQFDDWQLGSSTQETVELSEIGREIWELINALPENQRICMILYYYEDMKMDEIAEALEIPVGSVKSRLYYARRQLRAKLEQRGLHAAGALQAPAKGGAASQAGIFAKILATLEVTSENSTAAVAAKTFGGGLAVKLGIGLVSLMTAGGIIGAAVMRPDNKPSETPTATTTTAAATAPTTTTAAVTTTAPTTTTTTNPPSTTTTTTAPQPFVAFDYKTVDGGVAITQYRGDDSNVVIPNSLDGLSVVAIGSNAFKYNDIIESVTIPSTVHTVGSGAFRECRRLRSVSLGSGVNVIEDAAFLGCALQSVTIPANVRDVGVYAFSYCPSLTNVQIAEGTRRIGYAAFRDCPNLRSVTLPASVSVIGGDSFDGASPDLVMSAPWESYAHEYAVQKGFSVQ